VRKPRNVEMLLVRQEMGVTNGNNIIAKRQDRPDKRQDRPDKRQDRPDKRQDRPDKRQDRPDKRQDRPDKGHWYRVGGPGVSLFFQPLLARPANQQARIRTSISNEDGLGGIIARR
jgi:hypothetical protein